MTYKISNKDIYEDNIIFSDEENIELPVIFKEDENKFWRFFMLSVILHPIAAVLLWLLFILLTFLGIIIPIADKPEWKTKDIEFVLTQNEAEPINKKTPYRSDKNSRAGGKHDPEKKVSISSPAPAPQEKKPEVKPQPQPKVQQPVKKPPVQNPIKNIMPKPVRQPVQQPSPAPAPAKTISKPSKINAPVQKPVLKPSTAVPKAQMPKLSPAPVSPFKIQVPKTGAPVGKGFSTSTGTASTGGGAASGYAGSKSGSGMPAPQFSTTRTTTSSRARVAQSGRGPGGYGTGNMGNPGPGNPSGAPGVDAIKSPQWGPYMRELESKIKRNWFPPKGDKSKRVVLLFKIGKRGDLVSVRVSKSSGSQENDNAAIKAVQMSAPFRALPPEFTGSSVEIEFTFDYNVLGVSYR